MPDYIEYQRSISKELLSIKDRVRNFIDNHHWGEDGRYKEIILSHVLRQHLPQGVSVGTGFVVSNNGITKQIDIVIYRSDYPLLFKEDDFVIASAECVLGIIEVKSRVDIGVARTAIGSATDNGRIIGRNVFNGIFAFEKNMNNFESDRIQEAFRSSKGIVNNLCFGKDMFIKYWNAGMPLSNPHTNDYYAVYKIEDLAFGYFISNLVEDVHILMHGEQIPHTLKNILYPIENTKEAHREKIIDVGEV